MVLGVICVPIASLFNMHGQHGGPPSGDLGAACSYEIFMEKGYFFSFKIRRNLRKNYEKSFFAINPVKYIKRVIKRLPVICSLY
jgi:hypothetical protein